MLIIQDEYKHLYQFHVMFQMLMNHLNIRNKHEKLEHQNHN